jgi:hypothetical protein
MVSFPDQDGVAELVHERIVRVDHEYEPGSYLSPD